MAGAAGASGLSARAAEASGLAARAGQREDEALVAYSECVAGELTAVAALARLAGITSDDGIADLSAFVHRSAALSSPESSFGSFVQCFNEMVDWRARTSHDRSERACAVEAEPSARESTGGAPAASNGPNMTALLALQSGIRGMVLRRRVVDAIRFACWDRLDAWEELELLQAPARPPRPPWLSTRRRVSWRTRHGHTAGCVAQVGSFLIDVEGSGRASIDASLEAEVARDAARCKRGSILDGHTTVDEAIRLATMLQQDELPSREVVSQLLNRQLALLANRPNVERVRLRPGCRLTVVGDLHGQLADLLHIFALNGWPSEDSLYLFNGDFVDRGPKGVEVTLLLFAWQQARPRRN